MGQGDSVRKIIGPVGMQAAPSVVVGYCREPGSRAFAISIATAANGPKKNRGKEHPDAFRPNTSGHRGNNSAGMTTGKRWLETQFFILPDAKG
jgi:hypothetical protein